MTKFLKSNIFLASVFVGFVSLLFAFVVPRIALAACAEGEQEISISVDGETTCIAIDESGNVEQNPIYIYLRYILIFLAGGVGIAVVGGIVYGSYMYITARSSAAQTEKGQNIIINSVIGLLMFIFMYAILQFIIPGGIFG